MQIRWLRALAVFSMLAVTYLSSAAAQTPGAPAQNSAPSQTSYQPKFPGDPARSEPEANALGYMRTVIRAQKVYYKKNNKYASSLMDLVHTGSFTRRMANTDRGDYTVDFHSKKDGYELALLPKQQDTDHRSFYANDDGIIHADETKQADENSPKLK
jgi:hypothetical protein